jgi:hypothetical protein
MVSTDAEKLAAAREAVAELIKVDILSKNPSAAEVNELKRKEVARTFICALLSSLWFRFVTLIRVFA